MANPKKIEKSTDKLVYRLDEISRIAGLEPKVIETWEKELYFLNAGQTRNGHKIFRKKDLSIILRLKELLEKKGLTLAGAKRRTEQEFGIKGSVSVHSDKLKKILTQVRDQLKDIATALEKEQ